MGVGDRVGLVVIISFDSAVTDNGATPDFEEDEIADIQLLAKVLGCALVFAPRIGPVSIESQVDLGGGGGGQVEANPKINADVVLGQEAFLHFTPFAGSEDPDRRLRLIAILLGGSLLERGESRIIQL